MKWIFETERLRLRELSCDDWPFIIELLNSPGWLRYIGDRNVRNQEDAIKYIQEGPQKSYRLNGFGLYMVETKAHSHPIGMCGLLKRDTLQCPDIGFAFLPEYGGKGYAFEVAQATLRFAKQDLNIMNVCAITKADNAKSIRLLEKLGLVYLREIRLPVAEENLLLYGTDRDSRVNPN